MHTSLHNEQDLLQGLSNAEITAFDQLFNTYYRQLCYFAFSLVQDMQTAEDLATESFVTLWQKKPSFASINKLKSYLFTLVHHAALNQLKASGRHDASHREMQYLSGSEEVIDAIIIRSEALQAIYEEIEQLPAQCRQIIKLLFIEGKTVKEIATEMDLATQTVLNQKNRGIKLLRTALIKNKVLTPAAIFMAWTFMGQY